MLQRHALSTDTAMVLIIISDTNMPILSMKRTEERGTPKSRKRSIAELHQSVWWKQIRINLKFHFPVGGQLCITCQNIEEREHSSDDYDDQENDDNDEFFQSAATISDLNTSVKETAPTVSPFISVGISS